MKRKTLNKEIQYNGIGLHKGEEIKMKLIPAKSGGIVFKRVDLESGKNEISMDIENTFDLTRGTNLKNEFGAAVYTIEHFLSALYIAGITDLIVELDGNELPIGDGSARVFLEVIEGVGIQELEEEVKEIEIKTPINLTVGDKHIVALPYDGYKITYTIKFDHTFLKSQMLEVVLDMESYKNEIANARTFGFDYEIDYLKKNNLALGGTLDNAIVVKKDGVLNPDGLRFEDEFVRHKILDLIGDLKVLNRPIKGHIIAIKAGHALDIEFAKLLKKQEEKIC
ncbi:MAG: UDP-3-O-acyl-N-acetylglucosamine deacetylase [Cetobacterium somerae]|uniref:UDP-3-O-acyl-N-acetylglucosamine deacetylase n=1 Tax=Cetobacterium somerae ATCC BAA-474 TaxID=1319815 RepID=U7VFW4_9FUSO|nr:MULTISPECIES: UDP-3-O-acyl-N-acetylglucosamine deacetylase [Cetobacterium]ERT69668.1 UDP-3-O-[3-hydroxymyristoyl] N-acetylglucosamine deacetylase [Cetobacterium somerae ATCC BAA-474]MBC2853380.1 UDP-3-O-[3-hydroxymyristoyl] N-acetylglucosamine deacetylase [Cetobacterium sp. 2G large]MCQ9625820.1 UDP-3-O-[3-hydroxymyristoyl] N-acetylglucosamine deacetylase [Cetobacterium somerae]